MLRTLVIALVIGLVACGGKSPPPQSPGNFVVVDAPLTSESMGAFVNQRFAAQIADKTLEGSYGSDGIDAVVLEELRLLGITTVKQFAALIPADFDSKGFAALKASIDPTTNVAGLSRDLMIIHDVHGYFSKAWRSSWVANGPQDFPVPAAYGVDMHAIEQAGAYDPSGSSDDMGPGDEDGEPCGDDPCGE